jgi:hypothetical protein
MRLIPDDCPLVCYPRQEGGWGATSAHVQGAFLGQTPEEALCRLLLSVCIDLVDQVRVMDRDGSVGPARPWMESWIEPKDVPREARAVAGGDC